MIDPIAVLSTDLVSANQILLQQHVLDAFGHVSARHPHYPDRYLLARALPPCLVRAEDLLEFELDSEPINKVNTGLYGERFIHGSLYRARPDVHAICHHHSPMMMPLCISDRPLIAVSQTGAVMGSHVPVWDSREAFGDTNLLVTDAAQADSLAHALGDAWVILMRRHGVCVAGRNLRELVFRALYTCQDADTQCSAAVIGRIQPLSVGEQRLAGQPREASVERCWNRWLAQLHINEPR